MDAIEDEFWPIELRGELDPLCQPLRPGYRSTLELVAPWEKHAKRMPDKIAVQPLNGQPAWTWGELAHQARMMALDMKGKGVLPGARVALMGQPCAYWVCAIWATWICEGVWCPLPDGLTAMRRDDMLVQLDAQVRVDAGVVLKTGSAREKCPQGTAYMIFTPGPRGQSHAVMVAADGLIASWEAQIEMFGTTQHSRIAWMLEPPFDRVVSDIGVGLTAGATLLPVPNGRWGRWKQWNLDMEAWNIDQLHASAAWLSLFADHDPPASLHTLIAGRQSTPASILYSWSSLLRWVQVYGPVQASVCTSAQQRRVRPGEAVSNTLGTPFPGTFYRIVPLDEKEIDPFLKDNLAQEGELWIGGDAVALGYWKNAPLTEQHFHTAHGMRWFRTGDAVRKEGNDVHLLGPVERQVKLRGQLVHLDETEQVIAALPQVGICVACVSQDTLIGVVSEDAPTDEVLKAGARLKLPPWGVPHTIVRLPEWPLTINGKIDRKRVASMIEAGD